MSLANFGVLGEPAKRVFSKLDGILQLIFLIVKQQHKDQSMLQVKKALVEFLKHASQNLNQFNAATKAILD